MYQQYRPNLPPTYGAPSGGGGGQRVSHLDEMAALGILKHLSTEELQKLLDSDVSIDELIQDLHQVKALETERQMMMVSNKSLAEFNLSREPRLTQGKERLGTAYENLQTGRAEYDALYAQLGNSNNNYSMETIQALLMTGATTLDEETEQLAEDMLDKKLDVDSFLETFPERRARAHLRKFKAEKMSEIMHTHGNRIPPLSTSAPGYSGSNSTPVQIPMPGYYMR